MGVSSQAVSKWEKDLSIPDPVSYTHLDVYKRQLVNSYRKKENGKETVSVLTKPPLFSFFLSLIHI